MKISLIGTEAREKAIKGANYLADAVKSSLGPFGKVALLEKGNKFTNDGETISRAVATSIKDVFERRGALKFHEACAKANDELEDGSTTATTLAQAIMNESVKQLGGSRIISSSRTPASIKETLRKESAEIIEKLIAVKQEITSEQEMIESAIVSSGDKELGELIGKAQWKLGKDGVLIAEETADRFCSVEFVNGIRIDNGFGTSVAINNQEKQSLEVNDVKVIMTNYTFTEDKGILPLKSILDSIGKTTCRDVVIVGRAFSNQFIIDCQENTKKGFRLYPINAPYTDQNEIMKDMEAVLGGRYVNAEEANIEDMVLSDVGYAQKIEAKRYSAIFTGQSDDKAKERITARVKILQDKLKGEISDFERKNYNARISQLTVGYGIIKIGALSDSERKRLKDKADDAVGAVRAALQEGVVKGGGLAFKEISDSLPDTYMLKRPILSIYEQIMSSAPEGFMIEDWVRDPVKVLRVGLTVACDVAYNFANIGVIENEENKPRFNFEKYEEN